jgi:hypothetical protein
MTPIFADTFVFLAMISANDAAHAASVRLMNSLRNPLVTTAWVLTELADGLCARETRHLFLATEERIRSDKQFSVVPATQALFNEGCKLYRERNDKNWSLTDCISFVVMKDRGIKDVLTGDHHFEQAGFNALLK